MGTSKKTAVMVDINWAMTVPAKRSRIIAVLNDRAAAAPRPQMKRAAITQPHDGATLARMPPREYKASPANNKPRRPYLSDAGP